MASQVRHFTVSRTVDAPAADLFAFLANADNHVRLDTSGMVRASADHRRLTAVGDVFVMNMHNELMGDHQVENHVVVYEPDRVIGWAPSEPGQDPAGHTFVWNLQSRSAQRTIVSQTYDWSAFTHVDMLSHLPVLSRDQLMASVDLLADAVREGR